MMAGEEHVNDLIPAYVLDALDDDELVHVSEHLAHCDSCNAEVWAYEETVAVLGASVELRAPRRSLETALRERTQSRAAGRLAGGGRLEAAPRAPAGWPGRLIPAWNVVSLVLIAGLSVSNLLLWRQVREPSAPAGRAVGSAVALTAAEGVSGASGILVADQEQRDVVLFVAGLEPLGSDQQYQLWLVQESQPLNGGVFSVRPDGYGWARVAPTLPLTDYAWFGVTIEPSGGSTGPTGDLVLGSSS